MHDNKHLCDNVLQDISLHIVQIHSGCTKAQLKIVASALNTKWLNARLSKVGVETTIKNTNAGFGNMLNAEQLHCKSGDFYFSAEDCILLGKEHSDDSVLSSRDCSRTECITTVRHETESPSGWNSCWAKWTSPSSAFIPSLFLPISWKLTNTNQTCSTTKNHGGSVEQCSL